MYYTGKHSLFFIMKKVKEIVELDGSPLKREIFNAVEDFVMKGEYTKYSEKKTVLKYLYTDVNFVAKKLNIQPAAVRMAHKRITNDFFKFVDKDVFRIIESGTDEELRRVKAIILPTLKVENSADLFGAEFVNKIANSQIEFGDFDISDCKYELTLLHWLSMNKLNSLVANVDITRLGYLLRVIDGEAGTSSDRTKIMQTIYADNLIKRCKPEDRKKFTFPPIRPDNEY